MNGRCFFCGAQGTVEKHHLIFGTGLRKLSEKYGLTCDLCPDCHRNGLYAVHRNPEMAKFSKRLGEAMYLVKYDATVEDFIDIFGRNYL